MIYVYFVLHSIIISLRIESEYRIEVFLSFILSLLSILFGLFAIETIFLRSSVINGWSFYECLLIFGVFCFLDSFISTFLQPNLNRLPEYIRRGDLDFFLLRPGHSLFLVSFRYVHIWSIPNFVFSIVIIIVGMLYSPDVTATSICLFLSLLIPSLVLLYSIWTILMASAFWWVKVENLVYVFRNVFEAGRFPVAFFPGWLRFLLTYVVPIAFMTSLPATAVRGRLDVAMFIAAWLVAALASMTCFLIWSLGIRRYTSSGG